MGCEVHDQDFMYKGIAWPPIDRVCGGLLAHVMKIDGSRYPDFYEGLARFAVMEHNRTTKDAHLELVKIRNLNERIDDSVYWCFFRLEARDKISMEVATYRVVVTYLADKLRELRMFKAEGKNIKEVKSGSNEELMEYIKAMEQRYKEEFQKVKENQVQMETELTLVRENHAQLQDEFAMMKADIDMRFAEEVACSKSDQIAYRKAADSLDIPPGKKARCE